MRQKCILCVDLGRDTGGSVYVSASPSDCVLSIKHKLETLTGIPILSQTLYRAATPLTDSTPLHAVADRNPVTNLSLHVPIRGGACRSNPTGFQPFTFKDVTNEECFEKGRLTYTGHTYRTIHKGLSFQAQCVNQDCQSVKDGSCVCIIKGMYPDQGGYVSIRSEVFELQCPACGVQIPAENWQNILFTDCTASIKWILVDNSSGVTTLVTERGMYKRAKPSVQMINYHKLDVILK